MKDKGNECQENMADQVERWIEQRTGGRVHRLRVEIDLRGRLVIQGHTGSYYVRQLALAAVLETFEACGCADFPSFAMDIRVGNCNPVGDRSYSSPSFGQFVSHGH